MALIKASEIHKTFHVPSRHDVLKGIDLVLEEGETLAIMGRSGEGKSTLLHILGTIEPPSRGSVEICGEIATSSNHATLRNQHLGFIFQAFHLLEEYSAIQNVLMPAKIAQIATHQNSPSYQRAKNLLAELDLQQLADQPTKFLSGGEKQRLCMARAFCNNPSLILADEPTGNLDRASSSLLQTLLFTKIKREKKGLILVTHDQELASLCDKVYLLREGKLFL